VALRRTAVLVVTLTLGILSRRVPIGVHVWDKALGDALYAVAVYLALALVRPSGSPLSRALTAAGLCAAIEAFQLTGIPMTLARTPLRWLLGTSFAWEDLFYYAIGLAAIAWIDNRFLRAGGSDARQPEKAGI
jgi:hypothetical protein